MSWCLSTEISFLFKNFFLLQYVYRFFLFRKKSIFKKENFCA